MPIKKYSEPASSFAGAKLSASRMVRAGNFYYVSGQAGAGPNGIGQGDARAQTHQAFENVKRVLAEAGLGLEHIVKVNAFIADERDFIWLNLAMTEIFPNDPPARTTAVAKAIIDTKIEVDVVAYKED
ncbi:MAG: RidA family protein [Hyphomonadaceae bacterium]